MDEAAIWALLEPNYDWQRVIDELELLGRMRSQSPGLEAHHVEPERIEVIYLTPFEHLAIHICHAKLNTNRSTCAAVAAFVRPYPGAERRHCRLLDVDAALKTALISFGQSGGDAVAMNAHPNTIAQRTNPSPAQTAQRSRFGEIGAETARTKLKGKPRSVPITWQDKISAKAKQRPLLTCERCGKQVKGQSNLIQHQRSTKCKK